MEFLIWRVSDPDGHDAPCTKAYQKQEDVGWYVRLDSLRSLLDLADEVGDIMVEKYSQRDVPELTICDARLE